MGKGMKVINLPTSSFYLNLSADTDFISTFLCYSLYHTEFKLHPEELERWFTKIDHIYEHTRVPQLGEVLTPFYKTTVDKEQQHHLPIISHVNYK